MPNRQNMPRGTHWKSLRHQAPRGPPTPESLKMSFNLSFFFCHIYSVFRKIQFILIPCWWVPVWTVSVGESQCQNVLKLLITTASRYIAHALITLLNALFVETKHLSFGNKTSRPTILGLIQLLPSIITKQAHSTQHALRYAQNKSAFQLVS